jgi:hypothetical protein
MGGIQQWVIQSAGKLTSCQLINYPSTMELELTSLYQIAWQPTKEITSTTPTQQIYVKHVCHKKKTKIKLSDVTHTNGV